MRYAGIMSLSALRALAAAVHVSRQIEIECRCLLLISLIYLLARALFHDFVSSKASTTLAGRVE